MRIRNSELRLGIPNKGNLYFGIINNKFVIKKKNNNKELDLIQEILNSLEITRNSSHLYDVYHLKFYHFARKSCFECTVNKNDELLILMVCQNYFLSYFTHVTYSILQRSWQRSSTCQCYSLQFDHTGFRSIAHTIHHNTTCCSTYFISL